MNLNWIFNSRFFQSIKVIIFLFFGIFLLGILVVQWRIQKRKVLVVAEPYGQLGNRLILLLHFYSFAMKNNVELFFPTILRYQNQFAFTSKLPWIHPIKNKFFFSFMGLYIERSFQLLCDVWKAFPWFPFSKVIISPFLEWDINKAMREPEVYENQTQFLEDIFVEGKSSQPIVICVGWRFRVRELSITPASQELHRIFPIKNSSIQKIDEKILGLKNQFSILFALHVRRKDYKNWLNGRFYYSQEIYLEMAKKLETFANELDKNYCFVLFTDEMESVRDEFLKEFPNRIFFSNGNEVEDLYFMSKCNFIIGPPSTFSGWASFYGNTPLYYIFDPNHNWKLSDFAVDSFWSGIKMKLPSEKEFIL